MLLQKHDKVMLNSLHLINPVSQDGCSGQMVLRQGLQGPQSVGVSQGISARIRRWYKEGDARPRHRTPHSGGGV